MRTVLLFILTAALSIFAETDAVRRGSNISSWNDTASIATLKEAGTVRYTTTCYDLSSVSAMRIVAMANDTDVAGFVNDSMNIQYGYQSGCRVLNASGAIDTAWAPRVIIDTMTVDSYGVASGKIDTSSVTGYATMCKYIAPQWNEFFRIWANGLTGTNLVSAVKLKFLVKNPEYSPVRNK
ncbi:exported hypothetical protein [Gammaproteobacteria bacterium]